MKRKVSYKDIGIISYNLSKLYKDGIRIVKAFELLNGIPLKKNYKDSLKEIKNSIEKGNGISESFNLFKDLYPSFFIKMLKIGEETGKLEKVLKSLAKYYKSREEYKQKVIESLIYPCLTAICLILAMLTMFYFLIPMIKDVIFDIEKLPMVTRIGIGISNFLVENKIIGALYMIVLIIVFPSVIWYLKKEEIMRILKKKLKLLEKREEYRILLGIGLLIESGVNIKIGIDYLIESEKGENKEIYVIFRDELEKGITIEKALRKTKKISDYSLAIINIGEESGNLDRRVNKLVEELNKDNKQAMGKIVASIQPIVIGVVGFFFVLFVLVFILPIIKDIYGGIN
ncbi:MAG: type II secretion system F family protein [Clostridium sp.]|uniref:type II secretion system F family protein n=1 Tax=Clostridium sp. TaxID=1506 RepID=UPI003EE435CC